MHTADLVLYNGRIHTMADSEVVSAAAVRGGRIAAIGTDGDILPLCGAETECVDLRGACVVPGFNDSHCHTPTR